MEIINLRPAFRPQDVAMFDVQIGPYLRLFNLLLHRTPDGRLRTMAPKTFGKHSASFHPELAKQITDAAEAALKGTRAHGATSADAA